MKISGYTLVRNGTKFDYPYIESIRSLLPLVDELVVNVGIGEDDTLQRIRELAQTLPPGKLILFESRWPLDDPEKRKGGQILAEQSNLALDRCTGEWCLYLQADEVLHEQDYDSIRKAFREYADDPDLDGLLFRYVHFYGSFDVVRHSRSAYRREVRAIKKSSRARSVGDAQSFRLPDGSKPRVALIDAAIYHYGWVRPPEVMREKTQFMDSLYSTSTGENYRYKRIWGLVPFKGIHPLVMRNRIAEKKWSWDLKSSPLEWSLADLKKIALDLFERLTGIRLFEYRSYRRRR